MAAEIKQPQLANYENKPYFFSDTFEYVEFMAPANGATTGRSKNPRSELREMVNNGRDEAEWNGGSGTHTLELVEAIMERPTRSDGKNPVVCAQIHGADDDLTVARLHGANIYATFGDEVDGAGTLVIYPAYTLGTYFALKMVATAAGCRYYVNGVDKGLVGWADSPNGAYFKAGAYCQANPTNGGSGRAVVRIKRNSLKVTHV